MRRTRGLGALAALALPLLLGAGGCSTYKYYDIDVSFDNSFTDSSVGIISQCIVTVSGADHSAFHLQNCPSTNTAAPFETGTFDYASNEDSGTMKFSIATYVGMQETQACVSGMGELDVPITGMTTFTGSLVVKNVGPQASCTPMVTPPVDGGP